MGSPYRRLKGSSRLRFVVVFVMLCGVLGSAGVASASAQSAWWKLTSTSIPTVLVPGGDGRVVVQASNLGDAAAPASEGAPVSVTVTLPAWLKPTKVAGAVGEVRAGFGFVLGSSGSMTCLTPLPAQTLTCTFPKPVPAFESLEVWIDVKVGAPASGDIEAEVGGAGTVSVSNTQVLRTGSSTPLGVERNELAAENEGGGPDVQAGSHPFQLTSTIGLNENLTANEGAWSRESSGIVAGQELTRDLNVKLPPGLVGNANFLPQCGEADFATLVSGETGARNLCPANSAVGVALVTLYEPENFGYITKTVPIFNLTPSPGEPARFGWTLFSVPVVLDTSVRTGADYGLTVSISNLPQVDLFLKSEVTFWGVPGAPEHDASRGWDCAGTLAGPCEQHETAPKGFLTLPTSCAGSLASSVELDSWQRTGVFTAPLDLSGESFSGSLGGCNRLGFQPSMSVAPDGEAASSPTGLTVGIHVPQEDSVAGAGLSEADVRSTTVTLPEGLQLSPSSADGLAGCSAAQIGFTGFAELDPAGEPGVQTAQFTAGEQSCPDASKVATVAITTPLLANPLKGSVYLASPQNFAGLPRNPFSSLIAMYLVAKDPVSGVLIKVPGKVTADPVTGRLVSTFENTPQLPYENLVLHFFGGARAPLATPALCRRPGEPGYQTVASITPWSSNSPVVASSEFNITSGPNGSACPNPPGSQSPSTLPFAPSLVADMTSINAGGFSPLLTTIGREDGQQNIQAVTLHMPPGVSGILAGVPLCPEAQANAGTCGAGSLIGSTIVSVGLGSDPYSVTGGKVYLTEKYEGAPFGLSIVTPAVAGPFNLGTVVVRAKVEVDPGTAALTVTTDNTGPYKIPSILDGIPLQIKHVNVTIDRPGFTFNPTNCNAMQLTSTIGSTEGASAPASTPFQVTNCAALKFEAQILGFHFLPHF